MASPHAQASQAFELFGRHGRFMVPLDIFCHRLSLSSSPSPWAWDAHRFPRAAFTLLWYRFTCASHDAFFSAPHFLDGNDCFWWQRGHLRMARWKSFNFIKGFSAVISN